MFKNLQNKGVALVISSPSGAGKSSLTKALIKRDHNITFSTSVTTRAKRPNEVEGKDYFFVTQEKFDEMVRNNELLEFAEVFGHCYGIPRSSVLDLLDSGRDIIFDIDWQGARIITKTLSDYVASIYILPPSVAELNNRLRKRNEDTKEDINLRMQQVESDAAHYNEYDYVIINDDFNTALISLQSILVAERHKVKRMKFSKVHV